jgi:hypothetical protein
MSITDELREWMRIVLTDDDQAYAIADRIDAEHERQLEVLYRDMSDAEYVKLPVDANNEYIRPGDVMDGYGKTIEVVELRYGRSGWVLISKDGNGYADTLAFVHHHEPTVEDVLREFALACEDAGNAGPEVERIAAEYAAKLRLKEDA